MNLEEFRKICNEVCDNLALSKFNKIFCEFVLKSPEEKAERLIQAFPEVVKEIEKLRHNK